MQTVYFAVLLYSNFLCALFSVKYSVGGMQNYIIVSR